MKLSCIKKIWKNKNIRVAIGLAFVLSLVTVVYFFDNFPWKDILTGNILSVWSIDYTLLWKIFLVLFWQTWVLSWMFYVVLNKYYKES